MTDGWSGPFPGSDIISPIGPSDVGVGCIGSESTERGENKYQKHYECGGFQSSVHRLHLLYLIIYRFPGILSFIQSTIFESHPSPTVASTAVPAITPMMMSTGQQQHRPPKK